MKTDCLNKGFILLIIICVKSENLRLNMMLFAQLKIGEGRKPENISISS
jgi:hypothetical protein